MAKITQFSDGSVIYNVDDSVGKFGRNHKSDVQLVQLLLNAFIRNILWTGKSISTDPVPDMLEVNGICGSNTRTAILWYQKAFPGLAHDATMNSVEGSGSYGPLDRLYTLAALNNDLFLRRALPSKSVIIVEPLASELRKFSRDPADN